MKRTLDKDGELLVMLIGGVSGLGRLIAGPVGDMSCTSRTRFQLSAFALYGVLTIVIPLVKNYAGKIKLLVQNNIVQQSSAVFIVEMLIILGDI